MPDASHKPHHQTDEALQRLVKEQLLNKRIDFNAGLDPHSLSKSITSNVEESKSSPTKTKLKRVLQSGIDGMIAGTPISFPGGAIAGGLGGAAIGALDQGLRGNKYLSEEQKISPKGLDKRVGQAIKQTDNDTPFQIRKALMTGLGTAGVAATAHWPIEKLLEQGTIKNVSGLDKLDDKTLLELLEAHKLSPSLHTPDGKTHQETTKTPEHTVEDAYARTNQIAIRKPDTEQGKTKDTFGFTNEHAFFDPKGDKLPDEDTYRSFVKQHTGKDADPHIGSVEASSNKLWRPGVVSHELGHASIHREKSLTGFLQRHLYSKTNTPLYKVLPSAITAYATKDDDNIGTGAAKGALIGGVAHLPTLIPEFEATRRGIGALHKTTLSSQAKGRNAVSLALPFASYLMGSAGLNAGVGGLTAYLNKRKHKTEKKAFHMGVLKRASEMTGIPFEKLAADWGNYNPDTGTYEFPDQSQDTQSTTTDGALDPNVEWDQNVGAWHDNASGRYWTNDGQHINPYTHQTYTPTQPFSQTADNLLNTEQTAEMPLAPIQAANWLAQSKGMLGRGVGALGTGLSKIPVLGALGRFSSFVGSKVAPWGQVAMMADSAGNGLNDYLHGRGEDVINEENGRMNHNILPNGQNWGMLGNAAEFFGPHMVGALSNDMREVGKLPQLFSAWGQENAATNQANQLEQQVKNRTIGRGNPVTGGGPQTPMLQSALGTLNKVDENNQIQDLHKITPQVQPQRLGQIAFNGSSMGSGGSPIQPPANNAKPNSIVGLPAPMKKPVGDTHIGTSPKDLFAGSFPNAKQLGINTGMKSPTPPKLNFGFPKISMLKSAFEFNVAPLADDAVYAMSSMFNSPPPTPLHHRHLLAQQLGMQPQQQSMQPQPISVPDPALQGFEGLLPEQQVQKVGMPVIAPPKPNLALMRQILAKKTCRITQPNNHLFNPYLKGSTSDISRDLMTRPVLKSAGVWDFTWKDIWEALMGIKHPLDQNVNIDRKRVTSSNIRSMGYDPTSKTMEVEFNNKTRYRYPNVRSWQYKDFESAESKGKFFNRVFRPEKDFKKMATMKLLLKTAFDGFKDFGGASATPKFSGNMGGTGDILGRQYTPPSSGGMSAPSGGMKPVHMTGPAPRIGSGGNPSITSSPTMKAPPAGQPLGITKAPSAAKPLGPVSGGNTGSQLGASTFNNGQGMGSPTISNPSVGRRSMMPNPNYQAPSMGRMMLGSGVQQIQPPTVQNPNAGRRSMMPNPLFHTNQPRLGSISF